MTDDWDLAFDTAFSILREHGPLSDEEWVDRIVDAGHDEDVAESVVFDNANPFHVITARGLNMDVQQHVEAAAFTHRLTDAEIAADVLFDSPGLYPLTATGAVETIFPLLDKEECFARGVHDADAVMVPLPRGSLAGFEPGDLVRLSAASPAGEAGVIERVTETVGVDLAPLLAELIADGEAVTFMDVLWQAVADLDFGRTPTLPLGELIEQAGHVLDDELVGRAGFDFDAYRDVLEGERAADEFGLSPQEAATPRAFFRAALGSPDPVEGIAAELAVDPTVFDALDHPAVLFSTVDAIHTRAMFSTPPDADPDTTNDAAAACYARCRAAASAIAKQAPMVARPGGLYLAASAALAAGDLDSAEMAWHDIVKLDRTWWPALRALSIVAVVRGDYERALSLMREVPGAPEGAVEDLEAITHGAGPEPGRNEPCPCGSGRKYKVCHRGRPSVSPRQRNRLLMLCGTDFASLASGNLLLDSFYEIYLQYADDQTAERFADAAWPADVALIEGGLLHMLLATAGHVMPDEMRILAQQWMLGGRSVYDVEEVRPGESMTLRDLRSGDRHVVAEEIGSRFVPEGAYICTRIVPEGDAEVLYGGIEPVDPAGREELIEILDEGDPVQILDFFAARLAPGRAVGVEGDDIVFCTAVFDIADAASIKHKLSRRYGKPDDGVWIWRDGTRALGDLRLEPGELDDPDSITLVVSAMTEPRFAKLLGDVYEMYPDAALADEERVPAAQAAAESGDQPPAVPPSFDELPPEVQEAVRTMILDKEREWIDESVPALGGRTPRTAVEDPTTRDDVVRLLDSFPETDDYLSFSPARLRQLLDLPER